MSPAETVSGPAPAAGGPSGVATLSTVSEHTDRIRDLARRVQAAKEYL